MPAVLLVGATRKSIPLLNNLSLRLFSSSSSVLHASDPAVCCRNHEVGFSVDLLSFDNAICT
jgi:hypothetical protein